MLHGAVFENNTRFGDLKKFESKTRKGEETMKKVLMLLVVAVMGSSAMAAIDYDADVTPGVIFGSGNGNGYFVVGSDNNIEVGLRAKVPYAGIYNSDGAGTYSMSTGVHPKWGAPGVAWNFEFSVNVNLDGQGSEDFNSYKTLLSIDMDPTLGQSWLVFDPITTFTDNEFGNNNSLAQNSMNIGWLGLTVDPSIAATYDFKLGVYDLDGDTLLAETYMTVEVDGGATVPAPGALLLAGIGTACVGRIRRRVM